MGAECRQQPPDAQRRGAEPEVASGGGLKTCHVGSRYPCVPASIVLWPPSAPPARWDHVPHLCVCLPCLFFCFRLCTSRMALCRTSQLLRVYLSCQPSYVYSVILLFLPYATLLFRVPRRVCCSLCSSVCVFSACLFYLPSLHVLTRQTRPRIRTTASGKTSDAPVNSCLNVDSIDRTG